MEDENIINEMISLITLDAEIDFNLFKEIVLSENFQNNLSLIKSVRNSDVGRVEVVCIELSKSFLKSFNLKEFMQKYNYDFQDFMVACKSYLYNGESLSEFSSQEIIKKYFVKQVQNIIYSVIFDLPKSFVFKKAKFKQEEVSLMN